MDVLPDIDLSGLELELSSPIITCTIEGIIDEDDLRDLALGEPGPASEGAEEIAGQQAVAEVDDPADLSKIREKHHSIARLIAKGLRQGLVASITGYTESYLSVLLNNPSMQELIEMYRLQAGSAAEVIGENLRRVGGKALEKLEAKIDAGTANANELIQAAKLGLDRSGHGPQSTHKVETETTVIDVAEIAKLAAQARSNSRNFTIPVEEVRRAALPAPASADSASEEAA